MLLTRLNNIKGEHKKGCTQGVQDRLKALSMYQDAVTMHCSNVVKKSIRHEGQQSDKHAAKLNNVRDLILAFQDSLPNLAD